MTNVQSLIMVTGLVAMASVTGWTQSSAGGRQSGNPSSAPSASRSDPMGDGRVPSLSASVSEKMAIARNEERQKKLQADTAQLLALATKLKEDVDKTDKYTLSLAVVKRTTEIEKLAKRIRERMKD